MSTIARVEARRSRHPLAQPWGESVLSHDVVQVTVTDDEGATGRGLTWTPTIGGQAVLAVLEHDLAPWAIGRPSRPEVTWDDARRHLHEAGPGIALIALAGLDTALWDLEARRAGVDLVDLWGRRRDDVPAYGSGVNLHLDLAGLLAQVGRFVDSGYDAVKIKVGLPDARADVARVRAVRELLGPDRLLMIDANQRWDGFAARRALARLHEFDLEWIEEPLAADDLRAHRRLRRDVDVPIALGENVHTIQRFREFIEADAVDVIQPNIARVGGFTPYRRIERLAVDAGVRVAPHLLPELSARVALASPRETWVEHVERASLAEIGAVDAAGAVVFAGGRARVPRGVGLGLGLGQGLVPAPAAAAPSAFTPGPGQPSSGIPGPIASPTGAPKRGANS